jgi:hypothetical protein
MRFDDLPVNSFWKANVSKVPNSSYRQFSKHSVDGMAYEPATVARSRDLLYPVDHFIQD